jgi:predicted DCC family thiol-disulfide oxidoreductase YuxK
LNERCPSSTPTDARGDTLTVLYDGACPLCRREIAHYQSLARALADAADGDPAAPAVHFADVSDPAVALPPQRTRAQLLRRFHVRRADGTLVDGAAAFVVLWARLPGWRWLARLARVPGVTPLLELSYRAFLPLRPALQRWARRHGG